MRSAGRLAIAAVALITAACASPTSPEPTPRLILIELPVYVPGPNAGCAGGTPTVTVRLDPLAEPPAWFEDGARRLNVLWPVGYRLVADPLVVVDSDGDVVLRDDDRREVEICATADDTVVIFHAAP